MLELDHEKRLSTFQVYEKINELVLRKKKNRANLDE